MSVNRLSDSLAEALVRASEYKPHPTNEDSEPTAPRYAITIGREPGAQGTSVASAVGQLLGWTVYDNELLNHLARVMGTRVDLLKLIDEKPMSWLGQCVMDLVSEYNLSHDKYVVRLIATVRGLAEQGHCVIVGRGANFVLPAETTLKVRLVADVKDRIANIQRTLNLSEKEAAHWVAKTARERHEFIKRCFRKEVEDPHLYDVVLNTSQLSVAECADVIVATLHRLQARKLQTQPQHATV